MTNPSIDHLWQQAVRQHIASLPPEEVAKLLADAQDTKPTPDSNLTEQVKAAEQTGDWQSAFRLKSQMLQRLMNPNTKD